MGRIDITSCIERLEAFEDRASASLEAASIILKTYSRPTLDDIEILGELHPASGTELNSNVEVVATAHDASGRVIGIASKTIWMENFFGFEAFSLMITNVDTRPTKVRVYPKPC